jgi:serine protease Do
MKTQLLLTCSLLAATGFAEEIALKGGAKIKAPILKQADDATVVDLGYDVLRIPRTEVLATYPDEGVEGTISTAAATDTNKLYSVSMPNRITTAEATKLYAPSVVLVKTAAGLGSGFFINKAGYLITNFHVIAGEKKISITQFLQEDKILKRIVHKDVDIVATAPFHDLAVLKVNNAETDITPVVFAPEENLSIGETVFAIGNPLGLERTVTRTELCDPGAPLQIYSRAHRCLCLRRHQSGIRLCLPRPAASSGQICIPTEGKDRCRKSVKLPPSPCLPSCRSPLSACSALN